MVLLELAAGLVIFAGLLALTFAPLALLSMAGMWLESRHK